MSPRKGQDASKSLSALSANAPPSKGGQEVLAPSAPQPQDMAHPFHGKSTPSERDASDLRPPMVQVTPRDGPKGSMLGPRPSLDGQNTPPAAPTQPKGRLRTGEPRAARMLQQPLWPRRADERHPSGGARLSATGALEPRPSAACS